MEETPSLSKGIYVNKPKFKSPTKRKANVDTRARQKYFKKIWSQIEDLITLVSQNVHQNAVKFVVDFIQSAHADKRSPSGILGAIPTVALIMGVNMPDHGSLISQLSEGLQRDVGCLVVSLKSQDCSTLLTLFRSLLHSLSDQSDGFCYKRNDCTFETLATWYEMKYAQSTSRKRMKGGCNSLVIMLEDVEAFLPHVLQHFILICSHYLSRVPVVLVLGVATAMVSVHNLLPLGITSCLTMQLYTPTPAASLLNTILQQVLITSTISFRLGPKLLKFVTDVILYHDFSVCNLTFILKFCVLEHCMNSPASTLNYETSVAKLKMIVNNVPSFQSYSNSLDPDDDPHQNNSIDYVESLMQDVSQYNTHLSILLESLYVMTQDLPGQPICNSRRELYSWFLEGSVTAEQGFQNACQILRVLSLEQLHVRLRNCLAKFEEGEQALKSFPKFATLQKNIMVLRTLNKGPEKEVVTEKQTGNPLQIDSRMSRSEFQQHMRKMALQRPKSMFETWRDSVVDNFRALFSLLPSPSQVPLFETIYFDDVNAIKSRIYISPKATIHTTLVNPQRYLQCHCCEVEDEDDKPSTLPSISLAYKLLLESGKLTNIYDWLQSYLSLRCQDSHKARKKSKGEPSTESIHQGEFFQALSELQLLGIVRPSKRKTDHLERLTWGYC